MTRSCSLFVLLALLPPVPAFAQISAKQAEKELSANGREGLASFRAQLKAKRAEIEAHLDSYEAGLGAVPSRFDALDLFEDVVGVQDQLALEFSNALFAGYAGAGGALSELASAGPLNGTFPPGFYAGDGGTMDRHVAQVVLTWDRFYDQVRRRIARTQKLAEKKGAGLTLILGRSNHVPGARWTEDFVVSSGRRSLTIDTVMGFSNLSAAGDGTIAIGGQADDFFGSVDLVIYGDGGSSTETVLPDTTTERFTANSFQDFSMDDVPEGAYFVQARQGAGSPAEASIGVR